MNDPRNSYLVGIKDVYLHRMAQMCRTKTVYIMYKIFGWDPFFGSSACSSIFAQSLSSYPGDLHPYNIPLWMVTHKLDRVAPLVIDPLCTYSSTLEKSAHFPNTRLHFFTQECNFKVFLDYGCTHEEIIQSKCQVLFSNSVGMRAFQIFSIKIMTKWVCLLST